MLSDALHAVVLDASLTANLDPASFFLKKSIIKGWAIAVSFVFLAGLIYALLSSSLSTLVCVWEGKIMTVLLKLRKARHW